MTTNRQTVQHFKHVPIMLIYVPNGFKFLALKISASNNDIVLVGTHTASLAVVSSINDMPDILCRYIEK